MNKECVFPIGRTARFANGNCFIDDKGFVHTVAHILENVRQDYTVASSKGGVIFLRTNVIKPVEFRLSPNKDHARSVNAIGGSQHSSNLKLATKIPYGEFEATITSVIPEPQEVTVVAEVIVAPLKYYDFADRIVFHTPKDPFPDGTSGSLLTWNQPGFWGKYISQKSAPRILGIYSTLQGGHQRHFMGVAEIYPQVYGGK